MVRCRCLLAAGLIVASGCGKDDKPAAGSAADPKAEKPAVAPNPNQPPTKPDQAVAPATPVQIKSSPNGSDLKMVPLDSELVFGVDFAAVSKSALWKTFVEPRLMSDNVKATLADFKAKCNLDPMAAIKTVSGGTKGDGAAKSAVIVVHGPEKAKVMACMDKLKDKAEITKDGEIVTVKPKSGEPFAFTFTDDDSAIVVFGPGGAAAVKTAAAGTSKLDQSRAFVEQYNKLDTQTSSAWMLFHGQAQAFAALGAAGLKPTGAYGHASVTNGVALELRLVLESKDAATAAAQMFKGQVAPAKTMLAFDKLEVSSDGSDLKVEAAVADAKLPEMMEKLKKLAAAMGGGKPGMGAP